MSILSYWATQDTRSCTYRNRSTRSDRLQLLFPPQARISPPALQDQLSITKTTAKAYPPVGQANLSEDQAASRGECNAGGGARSVEALAPTYSLGAEDELNAQTTPTLTTDRSVAANRHPTTSLLDQHRAKTTSNPAPKAPSRSTPKTKIRTANTNQRHTSTIIRRYTARR